MTTKSQITKCIAACSKIDSAVSETFRTVCDTIGETLKSVFGPSNWELDSADVEAIVEGVAETATWKGTKSEKVRKSELRAVINGYPFLKSAAKHFLDSYGVFGKEHMLKIARLAPECPDAESTAAYAVEFFQKRDKATPTNLTQKQKLVNGLKAARNNCKGSAMLEDFDKFLRKHKLYNAVTK